MELYRAFSNQNNEMAAMLLYQTDLVGVNLFSYTMRLSYVVINLHSWGPYE